MSSSWACRKYCWGDLDSEHPGTVPVTPQGRSHGRASLPHPDSEPPPPRHPGLARPPRHIERSPVIHERSPASIRSSVAVKVWASRSAWVSVRVISPSARSSGTRTGANGAMILPTEARNNTQHRQQITPQPCGRACPLPLIAWRGSLEGNMTGSAARFGGSPGPVFVSQKGSHAGDSGEAVQDLRRAGRAASSARNVRR